MKTPVYYTRSTKESVAAWVAYKKHNSNARSVSDFVAGFNAAKEMFENSKKKS